MSILVWFVIGTRPEATKGWLFAKELAKLEDVRLRIFFSGQHTTLLRDCISDLGPAYRAEMPECPNGKPPNDQWRELFRCRFNGAFLVERPDLLCVLGDTDTVRIAAETANAHGVPIVHIEAGIRHKGTYDRPEPEEINRRCVTRLASMHFAPNAMAAENLRLEGVPPEAIEVVEDLSYCAISSAFDGLVRNIALGSNGNVDGTTGPYVLCTFHRSTSLWQQESLTSVFLETALDCPDLTFTIVTRPDSRWVAFYERVGALANVDISPPLVPSDFLAHILQCEFILTDSAGVQQEGLILGKPVVACRREIELYGKHPQLSLVPPPFKDLLVAVERLWPSVACAYRGDKEPLLSSVRTEGIRIARQMAWRVRNAHC